MSHTIELKKVSKYYAGEESVSLGFSRVDLNLDMGEFVAITGESGSGKSTLLNVISGLDNYDEGEMFVCGEDTAAYGTEDYERYRKKYIGNIFQDFNLINSYTVYQNIEAVMLLNGKKKSECKNRIKELIELVDLTEYTRTKVSKLSGGQKQRVAIARALAKDAPIIVADEPTGNLDSASAESVIATLSRVSADKLVVIVTHNYEQAEPYVTRKITMHDGKIIEDQKVREPRTEVVAAAGEAGEEKHSESKNKKISRKAAKKTKMRKTSEVRLGLRNTFNLATKFLLLFIVYFFLSTAVLGQYAATKNTMHESDILGYNSYFMNTEADRMVVTKQDKSAFSDDDIAWVSSQENVDYVVPNDIAIDKGANFVVNDYYVEGSVYPVSACDESELTYGSMPDGDYQIVVKADMTSEAYTVLSEEGESLIGKKIELQDMSGMQTYTFDKDVTIAGIILDDSETGDDSYYGYATIYVTDKISEKMLTTLMASSSVIEFNYGGTRVTGTEEGEYFVYATSNVPEGQAYILEDATYYYTNEVAVGKSLGIKTSNKYFESSGEYTVAKVVTSENCKTLLGLEKDDFDMFYSCVFINPADYNKLYDKGNFQISVFLADEKNSDVTVAALEGNGYKTMLLKDALQDMSGGYDFVIKALMYGRLLILVIILFYIAYSVIRLIMRSRNSYYSTLRILGATKSNTDNILRVELLVMMALAYAVDIVFVVLIKKGILNIPQVSSYLTYLSLRDYIILAVLLLVMSLLIANRYSRKIFTKSAMKTFREGA